MILSGTFDNHATFCREGWHEGKLCWGVSAQAIEQVRAVSRDAFRPWGTYPDLPRMDADGEAKP